MIIITGAAGFIGSCLLTKLNLEGQKDLVIVDEFNSAKKGLNYQGKKHLRQIDRHNFFDWVLGKEKEISFFLHIGARTDTAEQNKVIFQNLNLGYSQKVWNFCTEHCIPLIYASSAATYGGGEHGFEDDHGLIAKLKPLNPYGESKNEFDKWALAQKSAPPYWAGLKFFNVYGPNEYHKGRMASVILHTFRQVQKTGKMKLFRSHKNEFADGAQLRDFIYVKDVVEVIWFLMNEKGEAGIFNLGTGTARTFYDLATAVFQNLLIPVDIGFIDIPEDIKDNYQYFTEANMTKLKNAGYKKAFSSLEDGISEYVKGFLETKKVW